MKVLCTAHHRKVEVDGVPDHIAGRHGNTCSNKGQDRMGHWRGAGVEVAGCGRIGGVDEDNGFYKAWTIIFVLSVVGPIIPENVSLCYRKFQ